MSNEIHIALQMLIIVLWFVLISFMTTKKEYVQKRTYYLALFSAVAVACNLLGELISHKDMTYNSPFWYPINMAIQYVFYDFFKKMELWKDFRNKINKIKTIEKEI